MSLIVNAQSHQSHLLHHPSCYFCITEQKLGLRPTIRPYDAPILRTIKGS